MNAPLEAGLWDMRCELHGLWDTRLASSCPACQPIENHDHRDRNGKPEEKNYGPRDWRSWESNQQREFTPGLGRR